MKTVIVVAIAAILGAASASAQTAPGNTLSDTGLLSGAIVRITDSSGAVVQGKLVGLTPTSIRVKAGRSVKEWRASDILEIQKRHEDSVLDGALIGLGVGVAAGIATAYGSCTHPDSECEAIANAVFIPIGAGGGLAAGALIDRSMHRFDTVFRSRTSARSWFVAPMLSKERRGVTVAVRF